MMERPKCSTTTSKPSGLCARVLKKVSLSAEQPTICCRRLCQYSSLFAYVFDDDSEHKAKK